MKKLKGTFEGGFGLEVAVAVEDDGEEPDVQEEEDEEKDHDNDSSRQIGLKQLSLIHQRTKQVGLYVVRVVSVVIERSAKIVEALAVSGVHSVGDLGWILVDGSDEEKDDDDDEGHDQEDHVEDL